MIFTKEFIWYQDHFVHHLTHTDCIASIIQNGLTLKCGERSKSMGDTRKAIYFFDDISRLQDWVDNLYFGEDIQKLELLRFNLKRRKWYCQNPEIGDFYLLRPISAEKIQYLRIFDQHHCPLYLTDESNRSLLEWSQIKDYKPLIKKK